MKELTPIQKSPFCCYVAKAIPLAFDESLSYYECLCRLKAYLENTVIPAVNEDKEAINEIQTLVAELQEYVDNYFDELNIQEEVNNKLDEMVEDGTLENILDNYAHLQKMFNTIGDMVDDTSLVLGEKVKCLGEEAINDGSGGEFIITENSGDILLDNGYYATYLNNYQNNYYNEVTYEVRRVNNTDCYITYVPVNDSNGNIIPWYVGHRSNSSETPMVYAQKHNTTVTLNGGVPIKNQITSESIVPITIGEGNVYSSNSVYGVDGIPDNFIYLSLNDDRTITEYQANQTTLAQLQGAGCNNVIDAYYKLINNFIPVDTSGVICNESTVLTYENPRQAIGLKADGTLVIVTTDGRTDLNRGLTTAQLQDLFVQLEVKTAWNLDGGGSTSTTIKGEKINRSIDDNGTTDREIPFTINIKKKTINKNIANSYSQAGKVKYDTIKQILPEIPSIVASTDFNANTAIGAIKMYVGRGTNTPATTGDLAGYFINLPNVAMGTTADVSNSQRYRYNKQIYFSRDFQKFWTRTQSAGEFGDWKLYGQVNLADAHVGEVLTENSITTASTYQSVYYVAFNTNNSYIEKDSSSILENNHFSALKISGHDGEMAKITFNFSVSIGSDSPHVARFFRIKSGTSAIAVNKFSNVEPNENVSATISCIIPSIDSTNPISVEWQGAEGDSIYRCYLIVELAN